MLKIQHFLSACTTTFQQQGCVGKVMLVMLGFLFLFCLCSFPIAFLSPAAPTPETIEISSVQTLAVKTAIAEIYQTGTANAPTTLPTTTPERTTTPDLTETQVFIPTKAILLPISTITGGECDSGNQIQYVYHPDRLVVLKNCIHVTGVIVDIRDEVDGDLHILLELDLPYVDLLTAANADELGALVVEPVCVHTPTQENAIEPCSHDVNPLTNLPRIGQHVWMEGQYVTDSQHGGWAEIHPLSRWGVVDGQPVSQPPVIIPTKTLVAFSTNDNSVGGNCDPSYPDVCLQDGIGDYDCAGGTGNGPNYISGPIRVIPPDPFGLDPNHDGIGCN